MTDHERLRNAILNDDKRAALAMMRKEFLAQASTVRYICELGLAAIELGEGRDDIALFHVDRAYAG